MASSRWTDRLASGRRPVSAGTLSAHEGCVAAGTRAAQRSDRYVAELRRILARFGTARKLPKGASLFEPDDTSRHLYMVESGTIDMHLPEDPARHPIASFHGGASLLFDFGGYQIAALEAAEESVVIDVPFARLSRLCQQEMDLRILLRQCHAFDIKSFLDACYPGRSRFRLVPRGDDAAEDSDTAGGPDRAFLIPPEEDSRAYSGAGRGRRRRNGRRARRTDMSNGSATADDD